MVHCGNCYINGHQNRQQTSPSAPKWGWLVFFFWGGGGRRLRVVSNFGYGDCGVGEIHTREHDISRRHNAKGALPSRRVASKFRARSCVYFAHPTIAIAKIRGYSQSGGGGGCTKFLSLFIIIIIFLILSCFLKIPLYSPPPNLNRIALKGRGHTK